jgi:hypothetical protein
MVWFGMNLMKIKYLKNSLSTITIVYLTLLRPIFLGKLFKHGIFWGRFF